MDKLIELVITSGPAVLFIAAGLVWGKNVIEYFFSETIELKKSELNQQLETYKNSLARENLSFTHGLSEALEIHKNNLEVLKQKYQIQFSQLHQERAVVIKKLYAQLIELHSAMLFFTRTMQPVINDADKEEKERIDRVNRAFVDFRDNYAVNKIYFSKNLTTQIDKLLEGYWKKGDDFATMQRFFQNKSVPAESYKYYSDKMQEISEHVRKQFPSLIEQLEADFRSILGVTD